MIKTILLLIFEFMKTGLMAVGGGMACIRFLQDMIARYGWHVLTDHDLFFRYRPAGLCIRSPYDHREVPVRIFRLGDCGDAPR